MNGRERTSNSRLSSSKGVCLVNNKTMFSSVELLFFNAERLSKLPIGSSYMQFLRASFAGKSLLAEKKNASSSLEIGLVMRRFFAATKVV